MRLTLRQAQVLHFIADFWQREGLSPSRREVAAHFGFSVGGAQDHIVRLVRSGCLRPQPRMRMRGLVITEEARRFLASYSGRAA